MLHVSLTHFLVVGALLFGFGIVTVATRRNAVGVLMGVELLLNAAASRAPTGELVDILDVGFACAYLATPYARRITGGTVYVDGGVNIMA